MREIKISIPLKPLSVNAAFQGRRFKTKQAKIYERALDLFLPKERVEADYYHIIYKFFLKNFALTDVENLLKLLTDAIVRKGIIKDDRYIKSYDIKKERAEKDRIDIEIFGID